MSATVYQHPNSPVTLDPPPFDPREQAVLPCTPVSIALAKAEAAAERAQVEQAIRDYDWERAELYSRLEAFIVRYGAKRIASMVRTIATYNGEDV